MKVVKKTEGLAATGNSSRYKEVASLRLANAVSTVSPWLTVPISTQVATYRLSSLCMDAVKVFSAIKFLLFM